VTSKAKRASTCFVYVIGCAGTTAAGKPRHVTYVGWTNDVDARLRKHNSGKGARSTRGRTWVLLYSEQCASRRHAMSREWHLKRDRTLRRKLTAALHGDRSGS
jgi:putative endonuclease